MDSIISWFVLTALVLMGVCFVFNAYCAYKEQYRKDSEKDWAKLEKEWRDAEWGKWHE